MSDVNPSNSEETPTDAATIALAQQVAELNARMHLIAEQLVHTRAALEDLTGEEKETLIEEQEEKFDALKERLTQGVFEMMNVYQRGTGSKEKDQ